LEGEQKDSQFGNDVDGVGDLDGDGYGDFIVGAPFLDVVGDGIDGPVGKIYVYSGRDASLLFSLTGDYTLGFAVSGAGDVNGDGYPDFVAADPSWASGCVRCSSVRLFSGRNGLQLYHWVRDEATGFGLAMDAGADLDGDGRMEVVVGAPYDDENGTDSGSVTAFSLEKFYCDATPKVQKELLDVELNLSQTHTGNLIGLALLGFDGVPTFSFLAIAPADSLGRLSISGQVPAGSAGHDADFQAFAVGFNGKLVASAVEHLEFF
jgi:hypothetical protein